MVLGTPFGSSEAVGQFIQGVRDKHHFLLHRLALFPDPQVSMLLSRFCLGAQTINHLLRVLWSTQLTEFADDTSSDIRLTLDSILGTCLSDSAWLQSGLPIHHGGLGVQDPSMTQAAAVFSSALAEYCGAYSPVGEQVEPSAELWAAAEQFSRQIGADPLAQWVLDDALPPQDHVIDNQLHTQKHWSEKVHLQVKEDLYVGASERDTGHVTREEQLSGSKAEWTTLAATLAPQNSGTDYRLMALDYRL